VAAYRIPDAKLATKSFFSAIERDLRDHLVRSRSIEIPFNATLRLYGRPGETPDAFRLRCAAAADDVADAEIAALRDRYETKVTRLRDQIEAADDRVDVLEQEASSKRNSELLSTAGSILGGLLGGRSRRGLLGKLGTAAGRRGRTNASQERVDAAENKVARLQASLEDLEVDLAEEVTEIETRSVAAAADIDAMQVPLEKTDIKISQLVVAWMPVD
jgi:hypothetical protein